MAGAGIITAITAGISAGSQIFSGIEGQRSAEATQQAMRRELQETQAATRAKQIQNLERVNQAMGSQMVVAANSGYDLSSTSFNAVSADTLNKYEQDRNATALSSVYQQEAIDQQIQNAGAEGRAALFGGIAGAVKTGIDMYGDKLGQMFQGSGSKGLMQQGQQLVNKPIPQIGINYQQYQQSPLFRGVDI